MLCDLVSGETIRVVVARRSAIKQSSARGCVLHRAVRVQVHFFDALFVALLQ